VRPTFEAWLDGVREDARARGLADAVVAEALRGVERQEVVLQRDRAQAEFTLSFDRYLTQRLAPKTVRTGRRMMARHRALLRAVAAKHGVDPSVIVAIWGVESNFGRFSGVRPTIAVLVTLGYESRRAEFFRGELLDALAILDRGDIELSRLKGSWAGALGQVQFMPSSYLRYAVDEDGDGRRDIWSSPPDIFGSIANYLREHGWTPGVRWGRAVRVPAAAEAAVRAAVTPRESSCSAERALSAPLPLSRWRSLGVRRADGGPLPAGELPASLLNAGRRTLLVYGNYDALLEYNCANTYAVGVGLLADRLAAGR
jgi:membrane-bound lytic murein transglycosylase B